MPKLSIASPVFAVLRFIIKCKVMKHGSSLEDHMLIMNIFEQTDSLQTINIMYIMFMVIIPC